MANPDNAVNAVLVAPTDWSKLFLDAIQYGDIVASIRTQLAAKMVDAPVDDAGVAAALRLPGAGAAFVAELAKRNFDKLSEHALARAIPYVQAANAEKFLLAVGKYPLTARVALVNGVFSRAAVADPTTAFPMLAAACEVLVDENLLRAAEELLGSLQPGTSLADQLPKLMALVVAPTADVLAADLATDATRRAVLVNTLMEHGVPAASMRAALPAEVVDRLRDLDTVVLLNEIGYSFRELAKERKAQLSASLRCFHARVDQVRRIFHA